MKKYILLFLICIQLHAQSYPEFKPLRFDENYKVLEKDTVKKIGTKP